MDAYCNTVSNHCLFENAEINIDTIVVAVAELNNRILQLRKEIVAFKNENEDYLIVGCNLSSLTPSEFNDSTKNEEKRTGAQYELQRNFKGDDSPGFTDLSARLSFTKRALEVKAPIEAIVFKEDYPRDDKSIEDDERPNRSRVSEASGMYRKSISDAEKFEKEISERSGNIKDVGDVRISCVVDEKLKRPNNKCQNEVINDIYFNYNVRNVNTSKIKRKKISRGVQYTLIGCQNNHHGRFLILSCFGLKSSTKKHNLTQEMKKKEALMDKKKCYVGSRNEVNESLDATTLNSDESHNVKLNNTDMKKERFENDTKKIGKIIYKHGINCKKLFARSQNIDDDGKRKKCSNSKNRKVKINPFEKLWPGKALTRKNNVKTQRNKLPCNFNIIDDSENNKEIAEFNFKNNRMDGARNRECDVFDSRVEWNINIFDRRINSNNARESAITNSNGESIANKVKERLDSCIVELNEIISDACVVFDSGKNAAGRTADRV